MTIEISSDGGSSRIGLDQDSLQDHVFDALKRASALASPDPIDARRALHGALAVGDASEAFRKLTTLLSSVVVEEPAGAAHKSTKKRSRRANQIVLSAPFAASMERAADRIGDHRLWGREFVAAALLATDDPSLEVLAGEAGTELADLQDAWYAFVSEETKSNAGSLQRDWESWWHASGVPTPAERDRQAQQDAPRQEPEGDRPVTLKSGRFWLIGEFEDVLQGKARYSGDGTASISALHFALISQGCAVPDDELGRSNGSGTRRAIAEFQKMHGLPADGILGPQTLAVLDELDAKCALPISRWLEADAAARDAFAWAWAARRTQATHRQAVDHQALLAGLLFSGGPDNDDPAVTRVRSLLSPDGEGGPGRAHADLLSRFGYDPPPVITELANGTGDGFPPLSPPLAEWLSNPDVRLETAFMIPALIEALSPDQKSRIGLPADADAESDSEPDPNANAAPESNAADTGPAPSGSRDAYRIGRATLSGDQRTRKDSLKIGAQVDCFARLLAASDVEPPVSLGLFGNWGSGKSYFMSLLRKRIKELTGTPGNFYVRRVAHIEFNAWHYTDADLWANLALRIFDSLAAELEEKGTENGYIKTRTKLRRRLHSTRIARERLDGQKAIAEESLQTTRKDLAACRADRKRKLDRRGALIWQRVVALARNQDIVNEARGLAKRFGLDPAVETVDEAKSLAAEIREVMDKPNAYLSAVAGSLGKPLPMLGALVAVAGLATLAWWLLGQSPFMDGVQNGIKGVTSGVLGLAGAALPLIQLAKKQVARLRTAESKLSLLLSAIKDPDVAGKPSKEEEALQTEIDALNKTISTLGQQYAAASAEIAETEAEIRRLDSGGLVYDFASSMRNDDRYIKHLGIIATIRQDFRQLEELLRQWNTPEKKIDGLDHASVLSDLGGTAEAGDRGGGGSKADGAGADTADSDGNAARGEGGTNIESDEESAESTTKLKEGPPIDRIILYIDDLDRCHPDRVVEVLQAVHLLLALDLFMVVVAVDARWLERSLYKAYLPEALHHPRLHLRGAEVMGLDDIVFEGEANLAGDVRTSSFSPQNYLEKIFQIPYSLPGMSNAGYQALVSELTKPRAKTSDAASATSGSGLAGAGAQDEAHEQAKSVPAPGKSDTSAAAKTDSPAAAKPGTGTPAAATTAPAGQHAVDAPPGTPRDAGKDQAARPTEPEDQPAGSVQVTGEPDEPPAGMPDVDDDAIDLDPEEREYLSKLHGFVDTPRLTKRMVNIYRLLRVNAAQEEREEFLAEPELEFRAAMLLLAINIGYSKFGGALLKSLEARERSTDDFLELARSLDPNADEELAAKRPRWASSVLDEAGPEADALASLSRRIVEIAADESMGVVGAVESYEFWAPIVGKYSFQWHLDRYAAD